MDVYLNAIKLVPAPDLDSLALFGCVLKHPGPKPLYFRWSAFPSPQGRSQWLVALFSLRHLIPTASCSRTWLLVLESDEAHRLGWFYMSILSFAVLLPWAVVGTTVVVTLTASTFRIPHLPQIQRHSVIPYLGLIPSLG